MCQTKRDWPEDVQGGFNIALNDLKWSENSAKFAFHIADAPGHGKDICETVDQFPGGSPDGHRIQNQMKIFAERQIFFSFIKLNEHCEKMIKVMKKSYNIPSGITMNVTDLTAFQTSEEITNEFVKQAKVNTINSIRKTKKYIFERA